MRSRIALLFCTLLGCCVIAAAQKSSNLRPKWVGNTPKSPDTEYYFIEVHSDASASLPAARAAVKQEIASNVERTDKVSVSEIFEDKSVQNYDRNSNASMRSSDSYQLQLNVEGSSRPIKTRRIDEYWETTERGGIPVLEYHALYAVERNGASADFSNISTVSSYGALGLWRSAIVPGWGQFYKGSYLKGGLILGGTVGLLGGIIYTENQRSDYVRKISKTHDVNIKKAYATKRDHFATGRNVCIGAAAALYVYNLIDAIVAPGARRVITSNRTNRSWSYIVAPTVMNDGSLALTTAITF